MNKWKTRSGVVLTEIHGTFLLVSDKTARKHCAYLREINEIGAFIWRCLEKDCSFAEIAAELRNEYDIPGGHDIQADVDAFLQSLKENDYLICEPEGRLL